MFEAVILCVKHLRFLIPLVNASQLERSIYEIKLNPTSINTFSMTLNIVFPLINSYECLHS